MVVARLGGLALFAVNCAFLQTALPAAASEDIVQSAYGTPGKEVPAYADYAFKRGEWRAAMVSIDENGDRQQLGDAAVTSFYHSDGRTVQTCFNAHGFHSSDVRAYDEAQGVWRAQFLNARSQRWNSLISRKTAKGMETLAPGGYSGKESFDIKTEVTVIHSDQFTSKVYRRQHNEQTWRQTFELTYTRLPSGTSGPSC